MVKIKYIVYLLLLCLLFTGVKKKKQYSRKQNKTHKIISSRGRKKNVKRRMHNRCKIYPKIKKNGVFYAVYLGVSGYGTYRVSSRRLTQLDHVFFVNGKKYSAKIKNATKRGDRYHIQNLLQEGYVYVVQIKNTDLIAIKPIEQLSNYSDGKINHVSRKYIYVKHKRYVISKNFISHKVLMNGGESDVIPVKLHNDDYIKFITNKNKEVVKAYVYPFHEYIPPIKGDPGVRTLKNFIATALSAVGTGLYVYGGSWSWHNGFCSRQSTTIGVPQSWIDFFQAKDTNYSYKNFIDKKRKGKEIVDHSRSYYPYKGWNQYYYAGVDCSAFVSWVLYNITHTSSGQSGIICGSTYIGSLYSRKGWGILVRKKKDVKKFKHVFEPGDIVSVKGHVWICLGTCEDKSVLLVHSTSSNSITGNPGGGVQLSAIGKSKKCIAYKLADHYMKTYYSEWYERYRPFLCEGKKYIIFRNINTGIFKWKIGALLDDPDGYKNKTPREILEDLFE